MITYYKSENDRLVKIDELEKGCWINISPPFNHENIQALAERTDIPYDYFTDSIDIDERSRYEQEDGVKLIVIKTPVLNNKEGRDQIPYLTVPIGIITTKDVFVTISYYKNPVLKHFLKNNIKEFDVSDKNRFILKIFDKNVYFFLNHLKEINNKQTAYEKELYNSMRNQELNGLMNFEKSLVYFVTSLRSNELMMVKMRRTKFLDLTEEQDDLFEDIIVDTSQALEMANIYTKFAANTMEAFASIISNNLNQVMKRLTSVTIVLMVPTLIASFYGMNVDLPFQDNSHAFLLMLLVSAVMAFGLSWFFMKKRWF